MSAKQDRTAPRTPADLERKYNFDRSFGEVMKIATDARQTADQAQQSAQNCHSEIVKLADSITLKVTGGEAGNTASIVLTVGDEEYSGEINLTGLVTFESLENKGETRINGDNIVSEGVDENGHPVRLTMNGGKMLFEINKGSGFSTLATMDINNGVSRLAAEQGLEVFGRRDSYFGSPNTPTKLSGSSVDIDGLLTINGKTCGWVSDGNGFFTLKANE